MPWRRTSSLALAVAVALVYALTYPRDFVPSDTFRGGKRGFVFRRGARGLGYYRDRQPF